MTGQQKTTRFRRRLPLLSIGALLCTAIMISDAPSLREGLLFAEAENAEPIDPASLALAEREAQTRSWSEAERCGHATRFQAPPGYERRPCQVLRFTGPENVYRLVLYAAPLAQGSAVYAEVLPPAGADSERVQADFVAALAFGGDSIPLERLTEGAGGYRGVFGLSPWERIGERRIYVNAGFGRERRKSSHTFRVADVDWPVYRSSMDLGRFSNQGKALTAEERELIRTGRIKRNQALALRTELKLDDALSHPRDMHRITSPFWATRITERYRIKNGKKILLKPRRSVHHGLDFRAVTGAKIFAIARGRVVCAQRMFFEGNLTILDHGHGVFSLYMHQSRIHVEEGRMIQAGDEIGLAGATGAVTGAHLHLAVLIRGTPVHPDSLLALPLRN